MQKIAIVAKKELSKKQLTKELLAKREFEVVNEKPDLVFTFGGDGTFLEAVAKYGHTPTYIPINMGNLGFYTSWKIHELHTAIKDIEEGKVLILHPLNVEYMIGNDTYNKLALNEVTIINPMNTQILDVFIDGYEMDRFRGTGICVSTSVGSTAYNKSLSGSVIHSSIEVMQYTKIAPINNKIYRCIENPIVLGASSNIEFKSTLENFEHSILTIDRFNQKLEGASSVKITLNENKIKLLVRSDNSFWTRVKGAFLG